MPTPSGSSEEQYQKKARRLSSSGQPANAGWNSIEQMKLALKPENLAQLVFFIRGEKVMLDADLAALYGVRPKALNQAVKRNNARFPADFCFQLTAKEWADLKS